MDLKIKRHQKVTYRRIHGCDHWEIDFEVGCGEGGFATAVCGAVTVKLWHILSVSMLVDLNSGRWLIL